MRSLPVIFLSFIAAEVHYTSGYVCDIDKAELCKQDMIAYESVHFPFYGGNGKELDDTCKAMNETFECVKNFVHNCNDEPECDGDCPYSVSAIASMWKHSGLPALYEQLCTEDHPFRRTYLEHYECLEGAVDKYSMCYNTSQESQLHMTTYFDEPEKHLAATCCFFAWYQDCFTNATMETCGTNATFVVSFALHLLTGHISSQMCDPLPHCDKPPLPDSEYPSPKTTVAGDKFPPAAAGGSPLYEQSNLLYGTILLIVLDAILKTKFVT